MNDYFNPADIGRFALESPVSTTQLRREGMTLDKFGKDTSHNHYGKKNPEHSEYMKTAMLGKNKGNKRPDVVERNKLGHSAEARANISKNHADVSDDNNPMFAKRHTEETRKHMSEKRKGMGTAPKSAETKAKMSLARKKYWENRRAN